MKRGFYEGLLDGGGGDRILVGGPEVAEDCAVGSVNKALVCPIKSGLSPDPVVCDRLVCGEYERVALAGWQRVQTRMVYRCEMRTEDLNGINDEGLVVDTIDFYDRHRVPVDAVFEIEIYFSGGSKTAHLKIQLGSQESDTRRNLFVPRVRKKST
jgi:hypothetical protein